MPADSVVVALYVVSLKGGDVEAAIEVHGTENRRRKRKVYSKHKAMNEVERHIG